MEQSVLSNLIYLSVSLEEIHSSLRQVVVVHEHQTYLIEKNPNKEQNIQGIRPLLYVAKDFIPTAACHTYLSYFCPYV